MISDDEEALQAARTTEAVLVGEGRFGSILWHFLAFPHMFLLFFDINRSVLEL